MKKGLIGIIIIGIICIGGFIAYSANSTNNSSANNSSASNSSANNSSANNSSANNSSANNSSASNSSANNSSANNSSASNSSLLKYLSEKTYTGTIENIEANITFGTNIKNNTVLAVLYSSDRAYSAKLEVTEDTDNSISILEISDNQVTAKYKLTLENNSLVGTCTPVGPYTSSASAIAKYNVPTSVKLRETN